MVDVVEALSDTDQRAKEIDSEAEPLTDSVPDDGVGMYDDDAPLAMMEVLHV